MGDAGWGGKNQIMRLDVELDLLAGEGSDSARGAEVVSEGFSLSPRRGGGGVLDQHPGVGDGGCGYKGCGSGGVKVPNANVARGDAAAEASGDGSDEVGSGWGSLVFGGEGGGGGCGGGCWWRRWRLWWRLFAIEIGGGKQLSL